MPPDDVMSHFARNPFLRGLERFAIGHFATQGDGNHFAYVGHLRSTGQVALVTHHGSRGLGAQLYKRGMAVARRHTAIHAPKVPGHNAWIKASSDDGRAYWEALQVVRLPFWEAVDRVKRGEIRDLVSIGALLRIALMSAQGELPDPVDKLLWG